MTNEGDLELVRSAAARFRRALETTSGLVSISLASFPRGACGDAAVLVGQYLEDCGLGTWAYQSGLAASDSRHEGTHGWIEQDGVIVDITADQFGEGLPPVLVTFDRTWHSQFGRMAGSGHPASVTGWSRPAIGALRADYARLQAAADSEGLAAVEPAVEEELAITGRDAAHNES